MATLLEKILLQTNPVPCLTEADLELLLDGTADSRSARLKRAVQQQQLIRLRRGLYCPGEQYRTQKLNPYALANRIYAPSYISLESALSYHGLIPEAVYTVTSVTTKRTKMFHTSVGDFSYFKLPTTDFFIEVELIESEGTKILMAKPWKAICDYVFCYKKNWHGIAPLLRSLRIPKNELPTITDDEIKLLINYYQSTRIKKFLTNIKRELKL